WTRGALTPATTCALVTTRRSDTANPVPDWIWPHARPITRTVLASATLAARRTAAGAGCGTGPEGAGGSPRKTSGNPYRLRNVRTSASSDGGAGSAASRPRTMAEPRISRDRGGRGPFTRFSARNQIAASSARTETSEPPARSRRPALVACARERAQPPASHPAAFPIAAPPSRAPAAIPACAPGVRARPASGAARSAPPTSPAASPPYARTWRRAPRRNPVTAAAARRTISTRSSQFTPAMVPWDDHRGRPRGYTRGYTGMVVTIAHISDPHVGSPYFVPNLMNRVIVELNELAPDVVICSGDLTNEGYRQEYKNWVAYADRVRAPMHTVPGNHDASNVGYLHFEELIGPRHWAIDVGDVRIVGADSSEPDLNEGQIGRERYAWIREQFAVSAALKVFVLHH